MAFTEVCKTDDLDDGEMKKLVLLGLDILIARSGDDYFVTDNKCPHMGGNLSQGTLDGTVITCPVHHSKFNLKNGEVIRWTDFTGFKLTVTKLFKSPKSLKVYEIKLEDGSVFAQLPY